MARYEARVGDNHHHLVCRSCGTVVDVDCAVGARPCLTPSDDHGFVIDEAEVVYWGLLPRLLRRPAVPDHTTPPLPGRIPMTEHDAAVGDMNSPGERGRLPRRPRRSRHPTEGAGNRDWWPDRLNLKILAKNPAVANPMGEDFDYAAAFTAPRPRGGQGRTSPRC